MKFSVSWLREWTDSVPDVNELAQQLTMAGLEVENVHFLLKNINDIYVGRVEQVKPHPSADRLQVCMVDVGGKELLQIVCGAANVYAGMYAPVAIVSARINDLEIKQQEIRGVASGGMLCAGNELGLAYESDGLLDLGDALLPGTDFIKYLWLDDAVIDVDLTPNRADCFSIKGIAREVAALAGKSLEISRQYEIAADHEQSIPVTVSADRACPRYLARVVTGLNSEAITPIYMKERLCRSGVRPIHPVVDVMNYVMLELGQPMHAFDLDKLSGGLTIRFADDNEIITLLDSNRQLSLDKDTLIICDEKEPVAVAGIIGGQHSAVSKDTRDIVIECAFFTPTAVAGKARAYGLHTEASKRFERGVDFCLQKEAIEYACELIHRICGGQYGPVTEVTTAEYLQQTAIIELQWDQIEKRLGVAIDRKWVQKVLRSLAIKTKPCKGGWLCTVPSHRFDLAIEADLIEEIGRVYGYDHIPSNVPSGSRPVALSALAERRQLIERWRDNLVFAGYLEVITYSFSDPTLLKAVKHADILELSNPISPTLAGMRTSLWAGLLKTLAYNLNHQQTRLRIFEVGNQFVTVRQDLQQPLMMAGLVYGSVYPEQWGVPQRMTDFYDLKADLQQLFAYQQDQVIYQPELENPALHPGKAARIIMNGITVGCFGALNPELEKVFDVPAGVWLFELAVEQMPGRDRDFRYQPISRYPGVRRDLSVVVPEATVVSDLLDCIREDKPKVLQKVFVFDIYIGQNIEADEKSITFGLIFQDFSDTLNEQTIEEYMSMIVAKLSRQFHATIRRK